jgi:hypothetical protein
MKIAYMNPWENSAENQAYLSLAAGAAKLDIKLIDCRVAEDIENLRPDFVISVASSIPKVADYPSYLTLHEPRRRFLENEFYLRNLLTYDGFLTISDRLRRFAKDVCFGAGRQTEVGFYYNTSQRSELHADIEAAVRDDRLRVGYFGTNWDHRLPMLFRTLDRRAILRIHGPTASWAQEGYQSYVGPLPFDGEAPQRAYSQYGMGLVLLSADHLREDLISNRIFEITSVGAAAICPDIPCIRKWFRDSVFYFDATRSVELIADEIHSHYEFCRNNPGTVETMASRARAVFEQQFCAERMLENVAAYHLKIRQCRERRSAIVPEPEISVIIRCGGRPVETIRTAFDSVRRQTIGRFTVIFSLYAAIDLSSITSVGSDRIAGFMNLLTPGGDRYATLVAGLKEVRTEYFAILDDDDFWLSDHIESLFSAAAVVDPRFDVAFSGSVCVDQTGTQVERGLVWHRNVYTFGFRRPPASEWDVTGEFASNCFIARSDLILGGLSELPSLETAEDSFLVALVTRRKRPIFSYKATAFFRRGRAAESGFTTSPSRRRDVLSMRLRTSMLLGCAWLGRGSLQPAMDAWSEFATENPDPPALTEALGVPKLGNDFSESWELIERMSVGAAGKRISKTILRSRRRIEGHVCYGPYILLPMGRYTAEIAISPILRLRFLSDVGGIDVVSVEVGWEGAARGFTAADRKVSVPFEIPRAVAGKPVEFRVWSAGLTVFLVRSIRLIRYD